MKPTLIEAALYGINPLIMNIKALILALPLEQQENAMMILTGHQEVVPSATELIYNGRKFFNIIEIDYNQLTDVVTFKHDYFKRISVRLAFKKDSDEYISLKEKLAILNEDAAKELARAFSGGEYFEMECADINDTHYSCSLDAFKHACDGGDLNDYRASKSRRAI